MIYERAVPLLPGAAVAEFRGTFPHRSKAEIFARRLMSRPRRALRSITRRLKQN
jgi:ribose 1,5-bisphosphokinase PhnN